MEPGGRVSVSLLKKLFVPCLIFYLVISGCAAPGSGLGRFRLNGNIQNYQAQGEEIRVKIMLPKKYGLGGFDRAFGSPEDYGNKDLIFVETLDLEGKFTASHRSVYHASFFIIPPLGFIPKKPPYPVYVIGFSNVKHEAHLIKFKKEIPQEEIMDMSTRTKLKPEEAYWHLTGGKMIYEPVEIEFEEGETDVGPGWNIFLEFSHDLPKDIATKQ